VGYIRFTKNRSHKKLETEERKSKEHDGKIVGHDKGNGNLVEIPNQEKAWENSRREDRFLCKKKWRDYCK